MGFSGVYNHIVVYLCLFLDIISASLRPWFIGHFSIEDKKKVPSNERLESM